MNDNTNEKNPEIKENSPESDAAESKPEPSKWTENSKDVAPETHLDAIFRGLDRRGSFVKISGGE